jgi:hypothetical protein
MYDTPDRLARWTLSGKGKKASEPQATPVSFCMWEEISSLVRAEGGEVKSEAHWSCSEGEELKAVPVTKRSMALAGFVRTIEKERRSAMEGMSAYVRPEEVREPDQTVTRKGRRTLVSPLCALLEGQAEDSLVVPEPPVVGLVSGESGAVDSRLLAGAEADNGPVEGVADGVGLGVLERDRRDEEVESRLGSEL